MAMIALPLPSTRLSRPARGAWPVVLVLLWGSGCVSQAAYEEAQSAARVEREAHLRAETRLSEVSQALQQLKDDLDRRESALQEHERRLAEADLNLKLAHQERDENGQLVDQLRGELARVGDHLRVYSDEKARLAQELRDAESRSKDLEQAAIRVDALTAAVRDLSLLEGESINAGTIALRGNGQYPVLEVPRQTLAAGTRLSVDGHRIVKSLARLSTLHPNLKFLLSALDAEESLPEPLLLRSISEALAAAGVAPDKVIVDVADGGVAAPTTGSEPSVGEARILFGLQLDDAQAVSPAADAQETAEASPE